MTAPERYLVRRVPPFGRPVRRIPGEEAKVASIVALEALVPILVAIIAIPLLTGLDPWLAFLAALVTCGMLAPFFFLVGWTYTDEWCLKSRYGPAGATFRR